MLRETDNCLPKVRSTPGRSERTKKLLETSQQYLSENPEKSVRKLAQEALASCLNHAKYAEKGSSG